MDLAFPVRWDSIVGIVASVFQTCEISVSVRVLENTIQENRTMKQMFKSLEYDVSILSQACRFAKVGNRDSFSSVTEHRLMCMRQMLLRNPFSVKFKFCKLLKKCCQENGKGRHQFYRTKENKKPFKTKNNTVATTEVSKPSHLNLILCKK